MDGGAWWAAVHGVARSRTQLSNFPFTFHFHALEKEMATHSSVLAWRIWGIGEPGGLPSLGSHRVGHDWSDLAAAATLHINGLTWYVFFCVWQFSLNIMSMRIIHVVEYISSPFFLKIVCYFIAWLYHNLFSHFVIGRQWDVSGFWLLQYTTSIWEHISLARVNCNFRWTYIKSRITAL